MVKAYMEQIIYSAKVIMENLNEGKLLTDQDVKTLQECKIFLQEISILIERKK